MKIYELGKTCSPAKLVDFKEKAVIKVTMTCGGGVGGSKWYEYIDCYMADLAGLSGLMWFENYLGDDVLLNSQYVVKAEPVVIITLIEDVTQHCNFNREGSANKTRISEYCFGAEESFNFNYETSVQGEKLKDVLIREYLE